MRKFYPLLLILAAVPLLAGNRVRTWGVDVELLRYGSGGGVFYRQYISPQWGIGLESDWTVVTGKNELVGYDYFGHPYKLNSRNLSLLKTVVEITLYPLYRSWHPSFQPGLFLGTGPILALDTAEDVPFFTRWRHVHGYQTWYFRFGGEFHIIAGKQGVYFLRLGYDYSRFSRTIDERSYFGGIFFQAAMEFLL